MSQIRKGERVTRREFLMGTGLATGAALGARLGRGEAQGLRTITASHSVSTFVYGQHLVAAQKRFFEEEGLKTPDFVVPGGGAKVVQALAAGQVTFALGDSNHPLEITEKGKDALMLFATDTRCSYANIVVRKELFDRGVKSVEALADEKLVGRKAVIAATAIGSGTHVYGVYVLIGVVVGEFIGGESGGGLGYLIVQSLGTLNAADMMVALLTLGAIGIVMALGIKQVEARLLRWRPEHQKG